jgi:hypothetical protein
MEKTDKGGCNEGSNMRPNEILDSTSTRSSERLKLMGQVTISFFNEIDIGKELCSRLRVQSPDICFIF